jgi:hypothetical protein
MRCVFYLLVLWAALPAYALAPYLQIQFEDNPKAQYLSESGDLVPIFGMTKFAEGHASISFPSGDENWTIDLSLFETYDNPKSRAEHDALYWDTPEFSDKSDDAFWEIMGRRRNSRFKVNGVIEFGLEPKHFAFILVDGILPDGSILQSVRLMEKREGKWALQSNRPPGYGNLHNSCKFFRFSAFTYFLTGNTKYLTDSGASTPAIDRLIAVRKSVTSNDGVLDHKLFYKYLKAVRFSIEDPDIAEFVVAVYPPGTLHKPIQGVKLNGATKTMISNDLDGQVPRLATAVIEWTEYGGYRMASYILREFSSIPYPEQVELIKRWTARNEQ